MNKDKRLVVGLNGFGRFSLNLLLVWLRDLHARYRIAYINDEKLTPEQMVDIIKNDPLVTGFRSWKVTLIGRMLLLQEPNGRTERIHLTSGAAEQVSWLGEPALWFECSGARSTTAALCQPFLVGNTKAVVVSATCYDADTTLISGFNHESFDLRQHKVVSYGSCTVNPGVTLSEFFDSAFGVEALTVHVIHNVQKHRLDAGEFHTLQRKFCTLESMGPQLLPFLTKDNFTVKYTVVPYEGASIIDFAYRLKEKGVRREKVIEKLRAAIGQGGGLNGLIDLVADDTGPEVQVGSTHSAVFVESAISVVGDTVHLFGYFYNEGSGSRMHEVANYIATKLL